MTFCRMCGRRLTRPAPGGIGPVCARKLHPRPAERPGHTQPALEEPVTTTTTPARTVNEWNARYPVGTPVVAYPGARPEDHPGDERLVTRTRSKATVLGGHTAVVWVDGHSACINLTHIDPQPTPCGPAPDTCGGEPCERHEREQSHADGDHELCGDECGAPADDTAMQALSDAGAICGECGDEPGDRNCPDCERCYRDYVDALRKAGWAPRAEVLHEALAAVGGLVGQDPAIDNDTVMACHAVLAKLATA